MKRILAILTAAALTAAPAFSQVLTEVYPRHFVINSGEVLAGGFRAIRESDDDRMILGRVDPANEIQIEFGGYAPNFTGNQLRFLLETSVVKTDVFIAPVFQVVEMYNYRDQIFAHDDFTNWVMVDHKYVTSLDQLITITANAKPFVNKNDGSVRVRITWYSTVGPPAPHFHVGVDWACWMFEQ